MQRRIRKSIAGLFAIATALAVAYTVYLSLNPDHYFFYRPEDRAKWVYQPGSVAFICSLMLVEAALVCLAVVSSRPQALWLRGILGLTLLGPWALLSTMLVVHMPGYTLFHHLWVWLLVLLLVLVTFVSAARQFIARFRAQSAA